VLNLRGGERAALERLNYYFGLNQSNATTLPCVLTYKETRNGMIGLDFSTKFCLHLSRGCISPRVIYAALKQAEEIYGANESTYWVFFELLWRDYFRFYGLRYGKKMFYLGGVQGKKGKAKYPWREDTQVAYSHPVYVEYS
jgi:deoxyribodipyrimidine photo-lyase